MKTFDEVYAQLPGDGWLSENEARLLWHWLVLTDGAILEVGSHYGRSTCLLASTGRTVMCVDPWKDFDSADMQGDTIYAKFMENLRGRNLVNVYVNRCKAEEWPRLRQLGGLPVNFPKVSLAYLDGDHTYSGTKTQVELALACGADVVLVHDVNDSGGGVEVKRAAVEMLGPWLDRAERLAVWRMQR